MIEGYMYILSNKNRTVLYIGATRNLKARVELHLLGKATEFTRKYNVNELLYFEKYSNFHDAFIREKKLKNWHKEWKWNLIKTKKPQLKKGIFGVIVFQRRDTETLKKIQRKQVQYK